MRVLTLLFCIAFEVMLAAAPSRLERVSIRGREYYRLADWGKANGFSYAKVSTLDYALTNSTTRLRFTLNSQHATVNGTTVWLSNPVAAHNNSPVIPASDVTSTLKPLLWPTANRPIKSQYTICLDPGHGGKDTGNVEGKRLEKEYSLSVANELAALLRKSGHKVVFTRSKDTLVELDTRPIIARDRKADLFISLHFNAATSSGAQGAEVYCMSPPKTASTNARGVGAGTGSLPGNRQNDKNVLLAYSIQRAMVTKLKMEDRGVRRARWAVLRTAEMPAVLVECGFMTHPTEASNIASDAWRKRLAGAIADGIKNFKLKADPSK